MKLLQNFACEQNQLHLKTKKVQEFYGYLAGLRKIQYISPGQPGNSAPNHKLKRSHQRQFSMKKPFLRIKNAPLRNSTSRPFAAAISSTRFGENTLTWQRRTEI